MFRRALALTALATTTLTGLAVAAPTAQAATTATCYDLMIAEPAPGTYPLIPYGEMEQRKAQRLGLETRLSQNGKALMVCGSSTTIIVNFRYDNYVTKMVSTPVTSTADATFSITVPAIPEDMVIIPERSPLYLAGQKARANGLEVLEGGDATHLLVRGNPATVYQLWSASDIALAPASSVGVFELSILQNPDGVVNIWSNSQAVSNKARLAGLEVLSADGTTVVVKGDEKLVHELFDNDGMVTAITKR